MAERKVREFLLLREIAIQESLEIPEQEIAEAVASGDSRSAFLDRSRNERALEFVVDNAILEERPRRNRKRVPGIQIQCHGSGLRSIPGRRRQKQKELNNVGNPLRR